jgi:hypothetical protein
VKRDRKMETGRNVMKGKERRKGRRNSLYVEPCSGEQYKEMFDHLTLQRTHYAWRREKANVKIIGRVTIAVVTITE